MKHWSPFLDAVGHGSAFREMVSTPIATSEPICLPKAGDALRSSRIGLASCGTKKKIGASPFLEAIPGRTKIATKC